MASVLKDNLGTGLTRNILNNYVGSSAVSESADGNYLLFHH